MGNECVGKDFACWTGVAEADETGGVFVVLLAALGMRDVDAELSVETIDKVCLLLGGEMTDVFFKSRKEVVIGRHQMFVETVVPLFIGVNLGESACRAFAEVALLEEIVEEGWPFAGGDAVLEVTVVLHRVAVLDEEEL